MLFHIMHQFSYTAFIVSASTELMICLKAILNIITKPVNALVPHAAGVLMVTGVNNPKKI